MSPRVSHLSQTCFLWHFYEAESRLKNPILTFGFYFKLFFETLQLFKLHHLLLRTRRTFVIQPQRKVWPLVRAYSYVNTRTPLFWSRIIGTLTCAWALFNETLLLFIVIWLKKTKKQSCHAEEFAPRPTHHTFIWILSRGRRVIGTRLWFGYAEGWSGVRLGDELLKQHSRDFCTSVKADKVFMLSSRLSESRISAPSTPSCDVGVALKMEEWCRGSSSGCCMWCINTVFAAA